MLSRSGASPFPAIALGLGLLKKKRMSFSVEWILEHWAVCMHPFCFGQASDSSPRAEIGHVSSPQVQCMCNRRGKSYKDAYTALVVNKDFAKLNLSANIINTCWLPETSVSHPRRAKAQSGQQAGSDGWVLRQAHIPLQLQNSEGNYSQRPETTTRLPAPAAAMSPLEKVRNKSLDFPGVAAWHLVSPQGNAHRAGRWQPPGDSTALPLGSLQSAGRRVPEHRPRGRRRRQLHPQPRRCLAAEGCCWSPIHTLSEMLDARKTPVQIFPNFPEDWESQSPCALKIVSHLILKSETSAKCFALLWGAWPQTFVYEDMRVHAPLVCVCAHTGCICSVKLNSIGFFFLFFLISLWNIPISDF